jgi:hypothetical protein
MTTLSFSELLQQAVTEPSAISKAYSQFHNYSFGNQLLAWAQCQQRHITPGPLGTFARERSIAISPISALPHKTRFHEIAHVLIGHTTEGAQHDSEQTPRSLRECEAEAVALLCCAALDLPGVELACGYIQAWWGQGNPIPERSAQKILKTVDRILKAGVPA